VNDNKQGNSPIDDLNLENLNIEKFIHDLTKSDKYKWIFAGLDDEHVSGIEERTISRLENLIPGIMKLQQMMKDPKKAAMIKSRMGRIFKPDGSTS